MPRSAARHRSSPSHHRSTRRSAAAAHAHWQRLLVPLVTIIVGSVVTIISALPARLRAHNEFAESKRVSDVRRCALHGPRAPWACKALRALSKCIRHRCDCTFAWMAMQSVAQLLHGRLDGHTAAAVELQPQRGACLGRERNEHQDRYLGRSVARSLQVGVTLSPPQRQQQRTAVRCLRRRGARATAGFASYRPRWHARASCGKACLGMVASFGGLKHMHPIQVWPVFNDKPWACVACNIHRTRASDSHAQVRFDA